MKHHLSHVSSVQPKAQTAHSKLWRVASAALALSLCASASAQLAPSAGKPPATTGTPPASAAVAAPPPAVCLAPLSASNMQGVANFVWAGCPQLLNWPHDAAPRMSGPAPSGKASVHGYVLNYYAPSVYTWLKAGRPAGGIPDGALILKQMYADNNGVRGDVNGWALIIKQKSASYDGWLWGYVDPTKPKGGDGLTGDAFGNLYIAANGIHIVDPEGKPLGIIEVPERPANCTFGPTGSHTLYITARTSLYTVKLNVDGRR